MLNVAKILLPTSLVGLALLSPLLPATAQSSGSTCADIARKSNDPVAQINALGRARNLARQAAESANGGLAVYRAEAAMHGKLSDAPCVDNGDGSWTFTIKGGKPAFTVPTRETVVTVDSKTWRVKVDYNGAVRS